ncbi:MAG: ATP-binding protein [Synechococcus sp.]|nr:ATP-binding protein [Synechococcus sp.]
MDPLLLAEPPGSLLPLECLPVPVACFEPGDDPRLLAGNGCFRACFGLTEQERPLLSCWLERTYPISEYRRRVLDLWCAAAARARTGAVGSLQCRLLSGADEPLEVLLQLSCHRDLLVVVFQDITARSHAEAALEEARASLAESALAITEAIPVGTYTMVMPPDRPVAYFSFLSERFLQLCGVDRVRARQNPLEAFACVHPDDYDDWLRLNAEAFARKQPFHGECRVVVQGETRWVMAESIPRDLPDGSTVWEGVLSDISERVRAQQQLQESEQRLQRLLDDLPIPVATAPLQGDQPVLFCNRRFVESFGYGAADLGDLGHWMARAYPDPAYRAVVEQRWRSALAEAASSGCAVTAGEFTLRCADGRDREVLISAACIDDMMAATLVDLSERKQAERDLAEARARERRLEEQQRQRLEQKLRTSLTAAAVAHELNQPLSAILLQANLARDHKLSDGDPAALVGLLDAQVEAANRVVRVVEKMRSLLRNVQTEPKPVDLANLVETALLFRQRTLEKSRIQVHCRGLEAPCPIAGDGDQLQVAVSNLLRNAREALEVVPADRRRLEISLDRQGTELVLTVADSGSGFPAGMIESLPLATTKPDGTGLGLFVVQTTAENHGGQVHYGRSRSLGGAEVRLVLPLPPAAARQDPDRDAPGAGHR